MPKFTKSLRSNKTSECRRLAVHISAAASAMGLASEVEASRQSASHYVHVSRPDLADEQIKIRCSDHDDRHGGSDWLTWSGECPSSTIARLASYFGCTVPVGYRAEDYLTRSANAQSAAATRSQARLEGEATMVASVVDAMRSSQNVSAVAAGKVVDTLHPSITRAQRMRIANAASAVLTRDRAIAAAAGDEAALAKLAARHPEAMSALFNLVGPERFQALRPAGYPRSFWKV